MHYYVYHHLGFLFLNINMVFHLFCIHLLYNDVLVQPKAIYTLILVETHSVNPGNFNFAPAQRESLHKIKIPKIKKIKVTASPKVTSSPEVLVLKPE